MTLMPHCTQHYNYIINYSVMGMLVDHNNRSIVIDSISIVSDITTVIMIAKVSTSDKGS